MINHESLKARAFSSTSPKLTRSKATPEKVVQSKCGGPSDSADIKRQKVMKRKSRTPLRESIGACIVLNMILKFIDIPYIMIIEGPEYY